MEGAEFQVGTARPDLAIAVKSGGGERAGRQLEAEHEARRHILEEAGVHAHDLDVADILGVEGRYPGVRPGVGRQRAVGRGDPHHHAPIAVEIVAEADVVPLRVDFLVRIERRRGFGTADPILRLITAPKFEENAAAGIVLLRQQAAADVEHAATAGAGVHRRGAQADKRHERQYDCGKKGDRRGAAAFGAPVWCRRLCGFEGGRHGVSDGICAPRRSRMTARTQAGDKGAASGVIEHGALPAVRT